MRRQPQFAKVFCSSVTQSGLLGRLFLCTVRVIWLAIDFWPDRRLKSNYCG
jgi:hypothetical protein